MPALGANWTHRLQVEFVTIDVFTDRQFGGNPLAVVADGTALSTLQMPQLSSTWLRRRSCCPQRGLRIPRRCGYSHRVRNCHLPVTPMSARPLCWGDAANAMVGRSRVTLCNLKKSLG